MGLFRHESVWNIAANMDIALPGKQPLVAPSAMVQARKRLGANAVQHVFKKCWFVFKNMVKHWHGLNLLAVDGVVLRTNDTPDSRKKVWFSEYKIRRDEFPTNTHGMSYGTNQPSVP